MEFINGFLTWQSVIALFVGMVLWSVLFRGKKKEVLEMATLRADSNDGQKIEEALIKYKESEEFKALLEREFLRGKSAGGEEELANFTIQLDPFARKTGGVWNYVGEYGYRLQLRYRGLPIGDPTERIIEREQKVKTDEVWRLLEAATTIVERIAEIGRASKVPIPIENLGKKE